jgi:hypothetical protein
MHIVQKISSMLGVPPTDCPILHFEFFPLPFDRYITIYNEQSIPSNCYDYFNDIVFDLAPLLIESGIGVVQFLNSANDKRIKNAYCLEKFSYAQMSYLIKNSLLHICTDAYSNEIAGITETKSICLVGNRYPDNSFPWYGQFKVNHVLSHLREKHPSFALHESPKSINGIPTEEVSALAASLLGIGPFKKYKTIFTGSNYHEYPVCDFIPNFELTEEIYSKFSLNVRLDKFESFLGERNCAAFCSKFAHTLTIRSPVSDGFAAVCRKNCKKIIYMVSKETKASDVERLINLGFTVELFYLNGKKDNEMALRLLDFGVIKTMNGECPKEIRKKSVDKLFKTSKLILSRGIKYASFAHLEKGIPFGINNNCIDSPLFWADSDRFKIIGE